MDADKKMAEAVATLETAKKRSEEAKAEEYRLQMDLQAGMAASLLQLNNVQAGGGVPSGDQGAADAIPGPSVEPFHLPARQIPVTPLAPVIVMPRAINTPAPVQPGQQSQVEKARQAVEDECRRALEIYEANAEAQAREVVS